VAKSTFNGLHGVITQKTEVFLTDVSRTTNPTKAEKLLLKFFVKTETFKILKTYYLSKRE
jgi:hypothetical protein